MSTRVIQTLLCLLLALAGAHFSSGRTLERKPLIYDGYRLYQIHLLNEAGNNSVASVALATQHLAELRSSNDDLIFLEDVFMATTIVHVIVAPHMVPAFELQLKQSTMSWELLSANYKELLDNDAQQDVSVSDNYDWVSYYKLNDTYNFLNRLQKKYPRVVHRFEIGKSAEGRPIIGVHVSKPDNRRKTRSSEFQPGLLNPGNDLDPGTAVGMFTIQRIYEAITQTRSKKKAKPTIFVEAGLHGNQWITSAVATYIINELATSTEPAVVMAAKRYNWIILPHANPDGYVYTDQSDRLWSKSRSKHSGCIGVDLNRNFNYISQRPIPNSTLKCNKSYRGPHALSEPETKALSQAIREAGNNIKLYIALHLGPRKVKFSYDYEGVGNAPDDNLLEKINKEHLEILLNENLPHGGSSVEYARESAGILNAFNYNIGGESKILQNLIPGTQVPETAIVWLARDTLFQLIMSADRIIPIEIDQNNPPPGVYH